MPNTNEDKTPNQNTPNLEIEVRPDGLQFLADNADELMEGVYMEIDEGYDPSNPSRVMGNKAISFPINDDTGSLYIHQSTAKGMHTTTINCQTANSKLSSPEQIVLDEIDLQLYINETGKVIDYLYEEKSNLFPKENFEDADSSDETTETPELEAIEEIILSETFKANFVQMAEARQKKEDDKPKLTKTKLLNLLRIMSSVSLDNREVHIGIGELRF